MDIYKYNLIAATLLANSDFNSAEIQTKKEMRLCDCLNCRMGNINKCSTYNPKSKGANKK